MFDKENSIEVNNIAKHYKVYMDKGHTLKEKLLFSSRRKYEERHVLKGISFSVKKGEAIGLIGHNGSGKSTTLKLLTKIIYPDSGSIEMAGRVSSLIELGAGFHPDMSGRENIYINAAIFGLNRKEIDERIKSIIEFSELEKFIDNPVRTYSSGMYMRLAFAVAINVDADILLIDEILAVGDVGFQAKCFSRLMELKKQKTTIVIVSHSLGQIEKICDTTYWLDDGKIRESGVPEKVHKAYSKEMKKRRNIREGIIISDDAPDEEIDEAIDNSREIEAFLNDKTEDKSEIKADSENVAEIQKAPEINNGFVRQNPEKTNLPSFCGLEANRRKSGEVEFTDVTFESLSGRSIQELKPKEDIQVTFKFQSSSAFAMGIIGVGIRTTDGKVCFETNSYKNIGEMIRFENQGTIKLKLSDLHLNTGDYVMDVSIHGEDGKAYDEIWRVVNFSVRGQENQIGIVYVENNWSIK